MQIRRLPPNGREVIFYDATHDDFGSMAWVMIKWESYTGADQTDGTCAERVILNR